MAPEDFLRNQEGGLSAKTSRLLRNCTCKTTAPFFFSTKDGGRCQKVSHIWEGEGDR